jgi:acylphosphatase
MKRLRITVYGRVQRTGYRDAVAEVARRLGIKGSVRNLEDEVSIEIVAEGEEKTLKQFIEMINIKDYAINVERIDVKEEEPKGEFKYFKIIRGDPIEELGERMDVAGKLLYKMLEKQDQMLEKQDEMLKKQDQMLRKQDQMLKKQDQMIEKLDRFHEDTASRFDRMEEKYGKISIFLERISIALEALAGIKENKG